MATVDDAPERPTAEFVQALLDARGPEQQPARIRDVVWSSRFRVQHRRIATVDSVPLRKARNTLLRAPTGFPRSITAWP